MRGYDPMRFLHELTPEERGLAFAEEVLGPMLGGGRILDRDRPAFAVLCRFYGPFDLSDSAILEVDGRAPSFRQPEARGRCLGLVVTRTVRAAKERGDFQTLSPDELAVVLHWVADTVSAPMGARRPVRTEPEAAELHKRIREFARHASRAPELPQPEEPGVFQKLKGVFFGTAAPFDGEPPHGGHAPPAPAPPRPVSAPAPLPPVGRPSHAGGRPPPPSSASHSYGPASPPAAPPRSTVLPAGRETLPAEDDDPHTGFSETRRTGPQSEQPADVEPIRCAPEDTASLPADDDTLRDGAPNRQSPEMSRDTAGGAGDGAESATEPADRMVTSPEAHHSAPPERVAMARPVPVPEPPSYPPLGPRPAPEWILYEDTAAERALEERVLAQVARLRQRDERARILAGLAGQDDLERRLAFGDARTESGRVLVVDQLPPDALVWFIGDVHGDMLGLEAVLEVTERETPPDRTRVLVFLGDLVDDGFHMDEVFLRVAELVVTQEPPCTWLAGNHDEGMFFDEASGSFGSVVHPAQFTESLNARLAAGDDEVRLLGRAFVDLVGRLPRAVFFPGTSGLFAAHGGFPHSDLAPALAKVADLEQPRALRDFVWNRLSTYQRKVPNRTSTQSEFGAQDFDLFCTAASRALGRPVRQMVRGHDHVYQTNERYLRLEEGTARAHFHGRILTLNTMSYSLRREISPMLLWQARQPVVGRWAADAEYPVPVILHLAPDLVLRYAPVCPACRAPNETSAQTCTARRAGEGVCGAPLPASPASERQQRVASVDSLTRKPE